jgi:hypothetical protein
LALPKSAESGNLSLAKALSGGGRSSADHRSHPAYEAGQCCFISFMALFSFGDSGGLVIHPDRPPLSDQQLSPTALMVPELARGSAHFSRAAARHCAEND